MKRSVFIGVASAAAISTLAFAQTNPAPVPPTNPPTKTMPEGAQTKGTSLRQDLLSSPQPGRIHRCVGQGRFIRGTSQG
jgi:hypothetical protein